MDNEFQKLLLKYFLAWQEEQGGRRTSKQFAEHIGIGEITFNHVFTGRRPPGKKMVVLLAEFFNDPRFYDVTGMARNDPSLQYVQRNWGKVPQDVQRKITDMFSPYTSEPAPDNGETETP